MPNYRRIRVSGGLYFFTVALFDRRKSLLTENIEALRSAFSETKLSYPFIMHAVVIMPEHLHCMWQLPHGDCNNAIRWSQIKSRFSRQIPQEELCSNVRLKRRERAIWQRRFWEHWIVDDSDFRNHVNYIHNNPVKHGYVQRAEDWPFSSIHKSMNP
jgi:putative transposase